jgi:hypothetical protein
MHLGAQSKDRYQAFFWGLLMAAFIPASVWLMRERPIHASSVQDLIERTRYQAEWTIDFEQKLPLALNPPSPAELESRWQTMDNLMCRAGAQPEEAEGVMRVARAALPAHGALAPVFIKRGWLKSTPVWTVECAYQRDVTFFCGNTSLVEKERAWKDALVYWIAVIHAKPSYRVLGQAHNLNQSY